MESHKINMGCQITHYDKNNNIKYEKISFPTDESEYIIRIKSDDVDLKLPMKSFTKNFIQHFHRCYLNWESYNEPNTYYTTSSTSWSGGTSEIFPIIGSAGQTSGILVGYGQNTGSIYNYNLKNIIRQGTQTNQLLYQSHVYVPPYISGSSYECYVMRTAVNASSTSINVSEVALISPPTLPAMFTYDTINVSGSSININVPTGSTLSVYNYFTIGSGSYINYNFLYCLYSAMFNRTAYITSSIGNIVSKSFQSHYTWYTYANAGSDYNGIIIGSGSEPMNLTGYKIHEKVGHGTNTGQIYYLPMDLTTGNPYFPTTASMSNFIQRSFVNLNISPVTVTEAALYINGNSSVEYNDTDKIMVARTVFDTPLTLEYQEAITVRYIFQYQL